MPEKSLIKTDCLIIGSGVSGLICALELSKKLDVILVTKKELMESNTNYAQGGIAAVTDKSDSFQEHIDDTLRTGDGLSDRRAVEIIVKEAPQVIQELIRMGAGFNQRDGVLFLGREGGHSKNRIVHSKDATGKEIERALIANIRSSQNAMLLENNFATRLIVHDKVCYGAIVVDMDQREAKIIFAKNTILATGGVGQVYERTTNPKIATGDGIAMAFDAGCTLKDMEFVQFHPTTLDKQGCPHYLISEAVRGEGAKLVNSEGQEFMKKYHEMGNLAPRDVVSRAILNEAISGKVYLDLTHKDKQELRNRFPNIYYTLWWYGLKIYRDKIPVTPAAHYMCGGVKTDLWGRTDIDRLYAVGEVACTGVHGANRLASNSLLESVVFAKRASGSILGQEFAQLTEPKIILPKIKDSDHSIEDKKKKVQSTMWDYVGIERTEPGLAEARKTLVNLLNELKAQCEDMICVDSIELYNMVVTALMITESAIRRPESIGTHYMKGGSTNKPMKNSKSTMISLEHMKGFLKT